MPCKALKPLSEDEKPKRRRSTAQRLPVKPPGQVKYSAPKKAHKPAKEKKAAKPTDKPQPIEVKSFETADIRLPWRPYQLRFINDPSRRRFWVKAAQIGGSTAIASWSLGRCLNRDNHLVILLSASQPQSDELALKARRFVKEIAGVESKYQEGFFANSEALQRSITFPNGSRIIALPGNPDTARGYTGDIVLDEFAHHQNPSEIFTAAYRQVTLGDYAMLVTSTPNGQQGYFYQQAHELGIDTGLAPTIQPVKVGTWTGHWTDIYLAVREGLQVNMEDLRSGCDALTWSQEYCCNFLSESELWYSQEMISAAASPDACIGPPALYRSNLYAGWDVARSQNKSTIWFNEILGDVSICRGLVNLVGLPTPIQIDQARMWMGQVARMNIDKTGMGLVIAETLEMEYPQKAAGVQFTAATKEAMAVQMRLRLEQRKVRMPNDEQVRRSFLSLRRSVNKIGQARFDADNDEKWGHADEHWASCLAEMAAERQIGIGAQGQGRGGFLFNSQDKGTLSHFMTKVL